MWRLTLSLIAIMASSNAAAEWVQLSNGGKESTPYYDPTTMRKTDNAAKMWILLDFMATQKKEAGKPYLSLKMQYEFDCKEEQLRPLFLTVHTGHMGKGQVVHSESHPYSQWEPVPPDTVSRVMFETACGKR